MRPYGVGIKIIQRKRGRTRHVRDVMAAIRKRKEILRAQTAYTVCGKHGFVQVSEESDIPEFYDSTATLFLDCNTATSMVRCLVFHKMRRGIKMFHRLFNFTAVPEL